MKRLPQAFPTKGMPIVIAEEPETKKTAEKRCLIATNIPHDIAYYAKNAGDILAFRFTNLILIAPNYPSTSRGAPSNGAITKLTMAITFIKIFIEGPEVSLNGSPTVSPTTVAL